MSAIPEPARDENYILRYVEATISASARARVVMIVMITAAVLVFTVVWNQGGPPKQLGSGWLASRIELRQAALNYFYPKTELPPTNQMNTRHMKGQRHT